MWSERWPKLVVISMGALAGLKIYDDRRLSRLGRGSPDQRPSMGQEMAKGRRTEIEYLNGFVVREGR